MTTQFEKDLLSPHKDLFLEVRTFLLAIDGVSEIQKPRITTFSYAGSGLCHLRTMPHGIDVGFLKGAKMEDSPTLLTGKGKAIRVLPVSEFDEGVLAYYVDQALEMNRAKS